MDRPDHCSGGTFCAGDEPLDPDKMDQLSSDARYVRNGTYDEAVGFCHSVPKTQRYHNRMCGTVYNNAFAGFSVGMTSINTLLAPFLTPLLTYLYLRTSVSVDAKAMFLSIIQVVIVPIGLGVLVNRLFGKHTQRIRDSLPLVSVTAICLIVASVVSHNSAKILSTGAIIFVVVILHNLLGYLLGYLIGVLFKMDLPRKKAVAIEIGMQNSGLATTLAGSAFPNLTMATVPGAIFSVWHNISGAILAGWFNRKS